MAESKGTAADAENERARARAYRERVLAEQPSLLKGRIERRVVEGVERGLVVFSEDEGLAVAQHAPLERPVGDYSLGWQERAERDAAAIGFVHELEFILETGHGQRCAIEALGAPMERLDVYWTMAAGGLAKAAALATTLSCTPRAWERLRPALAAHAQAKEGIEVWVAVLEQWVFVALLAERKARAQARLILEGMATHDAGPQAFRKVTDERVAAVAKALKQCSPAWLRKELRRSGSAGKPQNPYGVAVRVASAVGVRLPEKRSRTRGARKKRD